MSRSEAGASLTFAPLLATFAPVYRRSEHMINFHPMTTIVPAVTGAATVAALKRHERWSPIRLLQWQESRLLRLLERTYQQIPYYHESLKRAGAIPGDIRSIGDLSRLPCLTKETVRAEAGSLFSTNLSAERRASLVTIRTTGSSGTPLLIYLSRSEYFQSLAHVLYGFLSAGAGIRDTFVHIHIPQSDTHHFAFEKLGILHQVHLDLRSGEQATLDALRSLDSPVVYSFPSYLRMMADAILQGGVSAPRVKLIVSNGEILTQEVRHHIQRAFNCSVVDSYGAAEVFRIAYECRHQQFHILPDSSIVEIDETTLADDGSAEIIVTPLYLHTMPLIRYKLGDRIVIGREPCPCGSPWKVIRKVLGRCDDTLVLPSGRTVSARAINALENVAGIALYQIVQKTRSEFMVDVKPSTGYCTESTEQIQRIIASGCAPDHVHVKVRVVDSIQRSSTGKLNAVISEVGQ